MNIYLPIAEIPVNIMLILALGLITGMLAGIFGIGGGFLATPLLMFIGISPAIAVSTSANQITASSISGLLTHIKRGGVDIKMGIILVLGGLIGSLLGVWIFNILQKIGQIDLVVALVYVLFLGVIGILMFIDSALVIIEKRFSFKLKRKSKKNISLIGKIARKSAKLPMKVYFPQSNINISLLIPIILGIIGGTLVSLMGIGGGFIMIPVMVYILKMPPNVIVGTSLFQIVFIAGNVTFLQAYNNNVDVVLAFLLIISSVVGAQIGGRISYKIDATSLRSLLSLMILGVCIKMIMNLFIDPASVYNIEMIK
jgi:uncharacterized membrane protein YfcA